MTTRPVPTEAEVRGYTGNLSNWGRWGPEDQLGTINLITPDKRRQAAALVRDGVSITCSRPIQTGPAADAMSPPIHYMTGSGEVFALQESPPGSMQGSGDFIGMVFHGYSITHLDALSHIFWNGQMYNGRSSALVTTRQGATAAGRPPERLRWCRWLTRPPSRSHRRTGASPSLAAAPRAAPPPSAVYRRRQRAARRRRSRRLFPPRGRR